MKRIQRYKKWVALAAARKIDAIGRLFQCVLRHLTVTSPSRAVQTTRLTRDHDYLYLDLLNTKDFTLINKNQKILEPGAEI